MKKLPQLVALIAALLIALPSPVAAQEAEPDERVVVSHGGWAAFGGFATFAGLAPLMRIAHQQILRPSNPEMCELDPEACEPGVGEFTLIGLTVLADAGLTVGGGFLSGFLAEELELDPVLGWGLTGGLLAVPASGLLLRSLPQFRPDWLYTVTTIAVLGSSAVGGGFLFAHIAEKRGHVWPEFGFGLVGLVTGVTVGQLICGGRACAATPLLGGVGIIVGAGAASLIAGYEPSETEPVSMEQQLAPTPLQLQLTF